MVVSRVIRIHHFLFLLAISFAIARAQQPSPDAARFLLERSEKMLSEAIRSEPEHRGLATEALYRYHNRTAAQLVVQNQLYPRIATESIDPQMVEAALPFLGDMLRSGDAGTRDWAAILISRAPANRAVAVLSKFAQNAQEPAVSELVACLRRMGAPAIPALLKLAKRGSPAVRTASLNALGELQNRGALPILLSSLADRNPGVRLAAAIALAHLGNPSGAAVLRQHLGPEVPRAAALALAAIGDPAQTKVVQAWLQGSFFTAVDEQYAWSEDDPYSIWPLLTAQELAKYGTPAAREIIVTALVGKRYEDRLQFLADAPEPEMRLDSESLRLGLEDKNPRIRVLAAGIAYKQDDSRGLDEILRLVTESDAWVHGKAIDCLVRAHTPEALAILRHVIGVKLEWQDSDVSYEDAGSEVSVISGIRKGGDASDVRALLSLVEDSAPDVACEAIHAVAMLSPGDAVRLLAPSLDSHRTATAICTAAALVYLVDERK
jgi:HEAT repeat protein